jgi:hypothetical protein
MHSSVTDENMAVRYNLGSDGGKLPATRGLPVNFDQAFANCTWFGS